LLTVSKQEGLLSLAVWHANCETYASFLLTVGAFRAKFYGNVVTPCQNVDTVS